MQNSRKKWIIGGSIVAGVAVLAVVGVLVANFIVSQSVTKEDYTKAAALTTDINKQSDAYGEALQAYTAAVGQQADKATLDDLSARTNTALDAVLASQDNLSRSPALRNTQVKQAYDAYNKKAQAFKDVATGYRTSIPLFVTMFDTCNKAFGTPDPSKNIFAALNAFTQQVLDFANGGLTKTEALNRFDTMGKGCIAAATNLQNSGTNGFAQLGAFVASSYANTRAGIVARYDNPNYDTQAVQAQRNAENDKKLAAIKEQLNKEATDSDYTAELKTLNQLLTDQAAKK